MTRKDWNKKREEFYDWYYNKYLLLGNKESQEVFIELGTGKVIKHGKEIYSDYIITKNIKFWGYEYIEVEFYSKKSLNYPIEETIRVRLKWNKINRIIGFKDLIRYDRRK